MNKISKILLVIVIILVIALGIITYYMFYYREAYVGAATEIYEHIKTLEDAGVRVETDENGTSKVILSQDNKVIIEDESQ